MIMIPIVWGEHNIVSINCRVIPSLLIRFRDFKLFKEIETWNKLSCRLRASHGYHLYFEAFYYHYYLVLQ
jgi:hypothetical protein